MFRSLDEVMIFIRLVPMDVNYNISKFELHWASVAYPADRTIDAGSGCLFWPSFHPHLIAFYFYLLPHLLVTMDCIWVAFPESIGALDYTLKQGFIICKGTMGNSFRERISFILKEKLERRRERSQKGLQSDLGEFLQRERGYSTILHNWEQILELGARRKTRCSQEKWRRRLPPLMILKLSSFSENL